MKVLIVSFSNSVNYGAVLQIYCLKKRIEQFGHSVSVLNYDFFDIEFLKYNFNSFLKIKSFKQLLQLFYYLLLLRNRINNRIIRFKQFCQSKLNLTSKLQLNDLQKDLASYDLVVCGSDQIWNPEITKGLNQIMFCDFNCPNLRKATYSASVGSVSIIDNEKMKSEFFKLLQNYDKISVRERDLKDYIEKNSSIEVYHTLDPSLLVSKSDLESIEKDNPRKKQYILVYRLSKYPEINKIANHISKREGLGIVEIVSLPFEYRPFKSIKLDASPEEFLTLFKNAKYVVTDSFHGTTFSIVYRKNFYTIIPKNRGSRVTNLLDVLHLEDRLISDLSNDIDLKDIDYNEVDKYLSDEKSKSEEYLKMILSL
jgi:hypothetical protein